ncbi:MAG: hypothetical protein JOZ81_24500 [Chloroflexi bacterium]|nr:hypothetical protein [Chloroflexota bacterium]
MILDTLQLLLIAGVIIVLFMAFVAPLESLRWWAGWSDAAVEEVTRTLTHADGRPAGEQRAAYYLVWLSGIGSVPGRTQDPFEVRFLEELRQRIPLSFIVDDAFAYSVRENPLAGRHLVDWVWRSARSRQTAGASSGLLLGPVIQLRNLLQVAVSADPRYGPIYNLGLAESIGRRLIAGGYLPGRPAPRLTLLGYSGGAQVAVGAATYLVQWFGAPVDVISIGGVIADEPGIQAVDHLYHLQGERDPMPRIGSLVFVGRWGVIRYSHWNRAVAAGKVRELSAGPVEHMAEQGYFGSAHVERTAALVANLVANGASDAYA